MPEIYRNVFAFARTLPHSLVFGCEQEIFQTKHLFLKTIFKKYSKDILGVL